MKVYRLQRQQFLPITLSEAWAFFSSPANLAKITPARMNFVIRYQSGNVLYSGQRIVYRVTVLPLVRVTWVTEIKAVNHLHSFTDEQRSGPYALWRHTHTFMEVEGGVSMCDEVEYALPLGWLGRLAHRLFVERQVNRIFDYRFKVLEANFPLR